MQTPTLITLIASAVSVVAALAALQQQSRIALLRADLSQLRGSRAVTNPTAPPRPTAANDLTESQRLELLQLRADLARLTQRQRELASARAENAALKARAATNAPAAPPPGWIRRTDARFAGTASPEAALQSFLWAIEQRDTNALLQLVTPAAATQLQQAMQQDRPGGFWDEARIIPGFRIAGVEPRSDSETVLKVEFLPGDKPVDMVARRVGQEWRLAP
jgi:hypothetical protein